MGGGRRTRDTGGCDPRHCSLGSNPCRADLCHLRSPLRRHDVAKVRLQAGALVECGIAGQSTMLINMTEGSPVSSSNDVAVCPICDETVELDDDSTDCPLHDYKIEHMDCHESGCSWDLIAAPGREALARHTPDCIAAAMGRTSAHDDETAREHAWQMIEDGSYVCICLVQPDMAIYRPHE